MPATSTTIQELKILKKGSDWVCRFQTDFDDGRFRRTKLRVPEADIVLYEGIPEIPAVPEKIINEDENGNPIDPPIVIPEVPAVPAVPPDPTALDSYIAQAQSLAALQVQLRDAKEDVSPDKDITATKEASVQQRAVAYLRKAMGEESALDAYLLIDRFNQFRLAQGWSMNQVQANLAAAGLTEDEWSRLRAAYQYLSVNNRPTVMAEAKVIQDKWEAR